MAVLMGVGFLPLRAEAAHGTGNRAFGVPLYSIPGVNGDFVIIGNTAATCPTGSIANYILPATTAPLPCAEARDPSAVASPSPQSPNTASTSSPAFYPQPYNDNFFLMNRTSPAGTSATLDILPGSEPIFAALFWGAADNLTNTSRGTVALTGGDYLGETIVANVVDITHFTNIVAHDRYSSRAILDVNKIKEGIYTVSNIEYDDTSIGDGRRDTYAGWALIVVYKNSTSQFGLPLRNIAVYDGFQCVHSGGFPGCSSPLTIPVSGFLTPINGPVQTQLGVVAYEGDRARFSSNDDYFELAPGFPPVPLTACTGGFTCLTQPGLRDANNFFNSSITVGTGDPLGRTPQYNNQMGFDIANAISSALPNSTTSATFLARSGGDLYYPALLVFRTDLHVPVISPNVTKTASDVNGGTLLPGDVLRYTISLTNTGFDTATETTISDNIPPNTTYVLNSLNIVTSPGGITITGAKTDASDSDQANVIPSSGPGPVTDVVFRVGIGANGSLGGNVPQSASPPQVEVSFDVTVNPTIPAGTRIINSAVISYSGQTTALTFGTTSSELQVNVMSPPVVTKSFSPSGIALGGSSQLTVTVTNPSTNPNNPNMEGVAFIDTYPLSLVNTTAGPTQPAPNPVITCGPGSSPGTLASGTGLPGGNTVGITGAIIAKGSYCQVTINVTAPIGVYINDIPIHGVLTPGVTTTNGGNNTVAASATLSVGFPDIVKAFATSPISTGAISRMSFNITNRLIGGITAVSFSDLLPPSLTIAASANFFSGPGCGGPVTTSPSPLDGATGLITVSVGTISGSTSCLIEMDVTSNIGNIYQNSTSGVTFDDGSGLPFDTGAPSNTATLIVVAPPTLTKSFFPPSIAANGQSTLTLVLENPNILSTIGAPPSGTWFTDSYPAGMTNATAPSISCTQGLVASVTGTQGGNSVGMTTATGASMLPGEICTITVLVTATVTGVNTTSPVSTSNTAPGLAASATLNISSLSPPTVVKGFSILPSPPASTLQIASGATATLTITLTNPNVATAINLFRVTDTLPLGIVVAAVPPTTTCSGSPSFTGTLLGERLIVMDLGSIPAGGTCKIEVTVTASSAGSFPNVMGAQSVTTTNAGFNTVSTTATLNAIAPPTIIKSFAPNPIAGPGPSTSTLTIVVENPSVNSAIAGGTTLTGVAFTDTYPTVPGTMTNNAISAISCTVGSSGTRTGNAGDGFVGMTGGTLLAPGGKCTITVSVLASVVGNFINTTGAVESSTGGTGATASATLGVGQPGIRKGFGSPPVFPPLSAPSIVAGTTTTMTIELTNPTTTIMVNANFTDTFPGGMTVASTPSPTNTCLGTFTATSNAGSVTLAGGTIPASGSCQVTVLVTTNITVTNVIPSGGLTANLGSVGGPSVSNGPAAIATLNVSLPLQVTKSFDPLVILNCTSCTGAPTDAPTPSQISTMTITLRNPTGSTMTGVKFTDQFPQAPGGNTLFALDDELPGPPDGQLLQQSATACTTDISLHNGVATSTYNVLRYGVAGGVGVTISPNGVCTIKVKVYALSGAHTYLNATGPVTFCVGACGQAAPATASLGVMGPPLVEKFFSPTPIFSGQSSLLTIRVTNPNPAPLPAITGLALTDVYPSSLVNTTPTSIQHSCTLGGQITSVGLTASAGGNLLSLVGGSIDPSQSCSITSTVTGSVTGQYINNIPKASDPPPAPGTSTYVTTSNSGVGVPLPPATAISATLDVLPPPPVTKSFSPPFWGPIGPQTPIPPLTMTITISNPSATAMSGVAFADIYPDPDGPGGPLLPMTNVSTVPFAACGVGTVTPSNPPLPALPSLSLIDGVIPGGGSCVIAVNVTADSAGSYPNATGPITTTSPANGLIPSASGTLVVSAAIYGTVYNDANHNANLEPTEGNPPLPQLYAKLIRPGGDPVVVVPVDLVTGQYAFTGANGALSVGTYTIVINSANDITTLTPALPAGWVGTEAATLQRTVTVPINLKVVFDQDFGLFQGSKLTGVVFVDTGTGGGGANDGIRNGTELGLPGVTVEAKNSTCGATLICDSTITGANGAYALFIPSGVAVPVDIIEKNLVDYISTGATLGSPALPLGATYTRATDTITFSPVAGTVYTGADFGDVPVNNFAANQQGASLPGGVLFYAHTFTAGTVGSVVFTSANASLPPPDAGWSHVIYRDDNCNAILDPTEITLLYGSGVPPPPTVPITTTPGQNICIIVKENVPNGVALGVQDVITVTATFTYTGSLPLLVTTHTVTDLTIAGDKTSSDLVILKSQALDVGCDGTLTVPPDIDYQQAAITVGSVPGACIYYRITFTNLGVSPITDVKIHDMTPAYTKFAALVACPASLPSGLTLCTVTVVPANVIGGTGSIEWSFTGPLNPPFGGAVEYKVTID